jgi:hypothetical protein
MYFWFDCTFLLFYVLLVLNGMDCPKVNLVRLSALRTGHLYSPGNLPGTHFCQRRSRSQGHYAVGRIISMQNTNDTIENGTRELPTCAAVPQITAPRCAPNITSIIQYSNGMVFQDRINTHKISSGKHELTDSLRR